MNVFTLSIWKHFQWGNNFDLHKTVIGLEIQFLVFLEWPFYTGFTVVLLMRRRPAKGISGHVRPPKIQITLRMRAV